MSAQIVHSTQSAARYVAQFETVDREIARLVGERESRLSTLTAELTWQDIPWRRVSVDRYRGDILQPGVLAHMVTRFDEASGYERADLHHVNDCPGHQCNVRRVGERRTLDRTVGKRTFFTFEGEWQVIDRVQYDVIVASCA